MKHTDWSKAARSSCGAVVCGTWCHQRKGGGTGCDHVVNGVKLTVIQSDICPVWAGELVKKVAAGDQAAALELLDGKAAPRQRGKQRKRIEFGKGTKA